MDKVSLFQKSDGLIFNLSAVDSSVDNLRISL